MAETTMSPRKRGFQIDNPFMKVLIDLEFAFLGVALSVIAFIGWAYANGMAFDFDPLDRVAIKFPGTGYILLTQVIGWFLIVVWAIAGPLYAARARAGILTGIIRFLMTTFFILGPLVIVALAAITIVGTFGFLFIAAWKEFLLATLITGLPFSILFKR